MLLNLLMPCELNNLRWFILCAGKLSGDKTMPVGSDGIQVGYFVPVELPIVQRSFRVCRERIARTCV